MNQYTAERWVLDRHQEVARQAEARSRLVSPTAGVPAGRWAAALLRRVADRLDGAHGFEVDGEACGSTTTAF
ncbi:MAG: hypothetical protein ACREOM_09560 [Candidatus Dormibacteraceae bacterium]